MADSANIQNGFNAQGSGSVTSLKRAKVEDMEVENNNGHAADLDLSPMEQVVENTKARHIATGHPHNDLVTSQSVDLPSEVIQSMNNRPLLSITLKNTKPKMVMVKNVKGRKPRVEFNRLTELWSKLEEEQGQKISLSVIEVPLTPLKSFLGEFGNVTSNLSLSYPHSTASPSDLQELLSKIPNLNHLWLDNVPTNWKSEKKIFSNLFLLSKIKTVFFGSSDCFYPELLMSLFQIMPNVNSMFNFPLDCLPGLGTDDKLKLDEWQHKFNILKNIKSIREEITILPAELPSTYPEMNPVKKLRLTVLPCQGFGVKFFGENFDPAKSFPNLKELTLDFHLADFCRYFPENVKFQGVTSLNVSWLFGGPEEVEALEKAARIFPNVTSFVSKGYVRGLDRQLPQVFRLWPKLISLKMKVSMSSTFSMDCPLDPVFTGFLPEVCNKLREYNENVIDDKTLQSLRKKMCVADMKELKELTLIFTGWYGIIPMVIPHLSHVAAIYGFQCVPGLKVTCAIPENHKDSRQIEEMLNPIKDYVSINHNYMEPVDLAEKLLRENVAKSDGLVVMATA